MSDPEIGKGRRGSPREPEKHPRIKLLCAAEIVPEPINWLWTDWIPGGKLTILAGDAGTGKTTLAISLAGIVSSGGAWPDGSHCTKKGNVLIWSGEDNPADTLVPRLIAAGADMHRCFFVDGVSEDGVTRPFDPGVDMLQLHDRIRTLPGGVSLIIVDPIVSVVMGNMDKANDVRRSLQSLVDLASDHGCAVVGITHFTKGSATSSPLHRVTGSQAFGALARMVLVAGKKEGSSERAMTRAKSNIAPDGGGVSYSIEVDQIQRGIVASKVAWGPLIEGSAREILGDMEYREEDDGSDRDDAERFLRDLLSDGPLPTKQVKADAEGAGYSWATIRRAQKSLGIEAFRRGEPGVKGGGVWCWKLTSGLRCSTGSLYVAAKDGEHLNKKPVQ